MCTKADSWREVDGVIYFSVTSDGTTGKRWIKRLERQGYRLGFDAKDMLQSRDFKPTNGVTVEVAVLKGMLFEDSDRITKKVSFEAEKRELLEPNAELACLIREKFTDQEIEAMGLQYIVVMHKPINDKYGRRLNSDFDNRLRVAKRGVGARMLTVHRSRPWSKWIRPSGVAFAVRQVSS